MQPGVVQHAQHVGVRREVVDVEAAADRRAEKQVLGERGVAVVLLRVEALDPVLDVE